MRIFDPIIIQEIY